jgi:hypothetical protein
LLTVGLVAAVVAAGQEARSLEARWSAGYDALAFAYRGETIVYPREIRPQDFPPPGQGAEYEIHMAWPIVSMQARWSTRVRGALQDRRAAATALMMTFTSDADQYEQVFPELIRAARVTNVPAHWGVVAALDDRRDDFGTLLRALRGAAVQHEIVAQAGFGAADFKIRTTLRLGVSADGKTLFYVDDPSFISDHVTNREFVLMMHDAGERICFECFMVCVCRDRWLFRGETMRRIGNQGRNFVERIAEVLDRAPTENRVRAYLASLRARAGTRVSGWLRNGVRRWTETEGPAIRKERIGRREGEAK